MVWSCRQAAFFQRLLAFMGRNQACTLLVELVNWWLIAFLLASTYTLSSRKHVILYFEVFCRCYWLWEMLSRNATNTSKNGFCRLHSEHTCQSGKSWEFLGCGRFAEGLQLDFIISYHQISQFYVVKKTHGRRVSSNRSNIPIPSLFTMFMSSP